MTTIVLADDHHIVLRGIRALFEAEPDFSIVGETGDGLEAIQLVEHLQPDVLVLDLMMPGLHGLEVCREARKHSPRTQVVILSMYGSEAYVFEALRAGARAYVLKKSSSDELVSAVREATLGRYFLGSPLNQRAAEAYIEKAESRAMDSYDTLTRRERQVLQLAAEGLTSTGIADRLSISRRTAETHRTRVMKKLGLRGQTDLFRYAMERGILPSIG